MKILLWTLVVVAAAIFIYLLIDFSDWDIGDDI